MKIYVGNLSYDTRDNDLQDLFAKYGPIDSCTVLTDRETGRSRGFGFVEMPDEAARKAIAELDGTDLDGRNLRINEARPRGEGGGGGGRGGRGRY